MEIKMAIVRISYKKGMFIETVNGQVYKLERKECDVEIDYDLNEIRLITETEKPIVDAPDDWKPEKITTRYVRTNIGPNRVYFRNNL